MGDFLEMFREVQRQKSTGSLSQTPVVESSVAPASEGLAIPAYEDPREQAIIDSRLKDTGNSFLDLYSLSQRKKEVNQRRQQRAYAEQADPKVVSIAKDLQMNVGDRAKRLEIIRKLKPEQLEEVLRVSSGVSQQMGDDRGGILNRTMGAVSRGVAQVSQPVKELFGAGGTAEEIETIRKLDAMAAQEFDPARPSDPWYERGPLQALQMAPWMATIVGAGGLGRAAGQGAGTLLARGAAAGVPGAKAAFQAAGAVGRVPTAIGLKGATTKGVFQGAGTLAGITSAAFPGQYAQEVDQLKEIGMEDDWKLRLLAGGTATVAGLVEGIVPNPFGGTVSLKQGAMKAARQYLWEALKKAPPELGEEYLQGVTSGLGQYVAQYIDKDAKEKTIADAFANGWEQTKEAALPMAFLLGVPAVGGAGLSSIRARRYQLEQIRAKNFVSESDAKAAGIEGNSRRERMANVESEIEQLGQQEAEASKQLDQEFINQQQQAQTPQPQVAVQPEQFAEVPIPEDGELVPQASQADLDREFFERMAARGGNVSTPPPNDTATVPPVVPQPTVQPPLQPPLGSQQRLTYNGNPIPAEYESLFNSDGLPLGWNFTRKFAESNGIGSSGVDALQNAVISGTPVSIDQAKVLEEAEVASRKLSFEQWKKETEEQNARDLEEQRLKPRETRTRADYQVTDENGEWVAIVFRVSDGSVSIFADGYNEIKYNAAFAKDKSDEELLAYAFEISNFSGAKKLSDSAPPAEQPPVQPLTDKEFFDQQASGNVATPEVPTAGDPFEGTTPPAEDPWEQPEGKEPSAQSLAGVSKDQQSQEQPVAPSQKEPWQASRLEAQEAGWGESWSSVVRRGIDQGKDVPASVRDELFAYDKEREAKSPKREEMPKAKVGDTVVRYTHKDGTGLLNNNGLDRSKLTDDEESELMELMDFGLQQPSQGIAGTFYFTQAGEAKHARMLELLSKASRSGVVRTESKLKAEPTWQSEDGQIAIPDTVDDENAAMDDMVRAEFEAQMRSRQAAPIEKKGKKRKKPRSLKKDKKPTATEQARDAARKKKADLYQQFKDEFKNKPPSGLDAKLAKIAVQIAIAEIEDGVLTFAAFVENVSTNFAADALDEIKPYFESAWRVAHSLDLTGDPGGKFDDALKGKAEGGKEVAPSETHYPDGSAYRKWMNRRHRVGDHPTSFLTGHSSNPVRDAAKANPGLGLVITPATKQYIKHGGDYSHIMIDNGAFSEFTGTAPFSEDKFFALLDSIVEAGLQDKVQFVVVPDKVGDWQGTTERWKQFYERVKEYGMPLAYVAQDGVDENMSQIPWDDFDVLFIGGSTPWKLGFDPKGQYKDFNRPTDEELSKAGVLRSQVDLIKEAKRLGKKIHMGRVNSWKRMEWANYGYQVDSADGNFIGAAPDTNLPKVLGWLEQTGGGSFLAPTEPTPAEVVFGEITDGRKPDLQIAAVAANNQYGIWAKIGTRWRFIGNAGANREQAIAKAKERAESIARGETTGVAFIGSELLAVKPKLIQVLENTLDPEQLVSAEKVAIGDQPVGFGKHANKTVKDLIEQEPGYVSWLIENATTPRAKQIVSYLLERPEFAAKIEQENQNVSNLVDEKATKLLAKFGLRANASSGRIYIKGETYEWKDQIRNAGGRWNKGDEAWSLTAEGFEKLQEELRGLPVPDDATGGRLPAYLKDTELRRLREDVDGRPDSRKSPGVVAGLVGQDTKDLISQGLKIGMPQRVVDEQIEDVGSIVDAYKENKGLFLLASEPGSGKTFVLGGAIRELKKAGAKKFTYVTLRTELIGQIKNDLKAYGIDDVEFITYPAMRSGGAKQSDVLIFDEAHSIKNIDESQQAKEAAKWIRKAGFTIFASATPMENPVQAEYLEPTGVFEDLGGFKQFALLFGANIRRIGDQEYIAWERNPLSETDARRSQEYLTKRGLMVSRRIMLPENQVDSRFVKIGVQDSDAARYDALAQAAAENAQQLFGYGRPYIVNLQKRLLEASKVNQAMDEAQAALDRGRFPIIFVETKEKRSIDIPSLIERLDEYNRAVSAAQMMGDEKPQRKDFGLPPAGVVETFAAYMSITGESTIEIPSAESVIRKRFGVGNVAIFTGSVTPAKAQKNLDAWRSGEKPLLVATMAKGGTGLSLHDKVGDHQTTQINVNLPWTATQVVQVTQRSARYGLKGKAEILWLFADNIPFDRMLSARVGGRMADMGASVHGQEIKGASDLLDWNFEERSFAGEYDQDTETSVSPWSGATVEDEGRWAGTTVNVSAKSKEEGYAGTVVRVLNKGETIEVQREGFDSAIRVPAERVSVIDLVDSKAELVQPPEKKPVAKKSKRGKKLTIGDTVTDKDGSQITINEVIHKNWGLAESGKQSVLVNLNNGETFERGSRERLLEKMKFAGIGAEEPGVSSDDIESVPIVTEDQIGGGADGTYDQMHSGLASKLVQQKMALGMKGIDGREYGIFEHSEGKWQLVSRPAATRDKKDPYAESSPESQQRRKDIDEAWSDMRSYYQLDPDSTVEVGLRDMIDGFVSGDSKPPRVAGNPDGKAYEYTGGDKRLNAIKKRAQTVANKTSAVQAVVVVGNVNTGVPTHAVIVSSPGFVGSEYNPQDSKHFAWVNSLEKLYPGMVVDVVVPTEKKIGRKDTGASEIKPRDRFIDSAGQEWEAYSSRGGVVIAHPVVDDKPQVNRDSQASFAVTDAAKSRHPEYKTDIVSVTKWKGEETTVSKEKQEDEKEKPREGEQSGQGPMGQDRRAISEYGVKGKSASVITADKSTRRATYYAVEADSLIPSHDARKNFAKNEGSLENERPYEDPKEGADSRQTVRSIAEVDKEKRYLLTSDTMSPTDGPPIVDLYGRVLGGNARSMGMQLAYAGPNADVLRSHMRAEGAKFEIPQEQLDALNNPVIIRVIEEPFDENTISSLLNESLAAAKSQATVVVSQSKRLSEETIDLVASILGAETEPSLREVMANPRQSTRIVQSIVRDGAWSDKDIAVYVDPGTGDLTAEGKLAIENMLVARVIPNVSLLGDVAPAVKQKILSAIGPLTKGLASEKFGKQLLDDLVAAIEAYDGYIAERKTNSLQSYFFEQKQMFPVPGHGSVTVAGIVHALADFTPTKFRNAMRDVVESLGIGERTPSLFGDDVTYDTIEDAVRNVINPPLRKDNDLLMQLDDRITDPPQSLFQSDPDIDATIRSKALDLGIAANEAGITAFDDFVRYSLKRNGEKLTRYMGAYLAMVGKTVGMTGVRPVKDILGVPMTPAEYVQLGKEAFAGSPQVTPEQVEAGIEAAMLTGLPQMAVGFSPAGTPVPGRKTREVLTQGDFDQPADYKFTESDYRPAVVSYARDKWGDAMASNGKPTWQNFVRWFGDSEVVDKDGKPLVVYHGGAATIDDNIIRTPFFYMTENKDEAQYFHPGVTLHEFYVRMSKPHHVDKHLDNFVDFREYADEHEELAPEDAEYADELRESTQAALTLVETLKAKGNDGIIMLGELDEDYKNYLAFDPTQVKSATGNRGTFDPNNPNMLYQEEAPRWYLKSRKLIQDKMGPKATSEQVLGMLRKNGVNDEELYWSGLEELLGSKQTVTKDEVLAAIDNGLRIEEVTLGGQPNRYANMNRQQLIYAYIDEIGYDPEEGEAESISTENIRRNLEENFAEVRQRDTKFKKYTLPGGENYKELLITRPDTAKDKERKSFKKLGELDPNTPEYDAAYEQHKADFMAARNAKEYKSQHWDQPNVLAHLRFNERMDADGKRVMFIEEVQSDWHQEGRKKGYATDAAAKLPAGFTLKNSFGQTWWVEDVNGKMVNPFKRPSREEAIGEAINGRSTSDTLQQNIATGESGVPDAPFKKSWMILAMKRAIQHAAENGFDRIAWTTGEQQADRYDLSKQVDAIQWSEKHQRLVASKMGKAVIDEKGVTSDKLEGFIGKEAAKKLLEQPDVPFQWASGSGKALDGDNLKVGGEGMKAFYDKMLPNETNKLIKKFGVNVKSTIINQTKAENDDGTLNQTPFGNTSEGITVQSFDITPAMRESALQYGQTLFQTQQQGGNVKGWTKFISGTRALIGATSKADISTVIHEYAHVIRRFLLNRDVPQDQRIDITDEEIEALEKASGAGSFVDGKWVTKWDVPAEEKFAKMWEQYFFEGKSPNTLLDSLFEKISRWMQQVYQSAMSITGGTLDPEVRDLFDKMVQRQLPADQRTGARSRDGGKDKPPIYLPVTSDQWGDNLTSLANAAANATRERLKLPSLTEPASEGFQEWLDAAVVLMRNDPTYANRLVKELQQSSRSIDDVDVAVLNLHYRHLKNLSDAAANRLFKAIDDKQGDVAIVQARRESDALINEIEDFTDMTKKVGTEAGRALVARKIALAEDYTLGNLLLKARVANVGQPLSETQLQEQRELADKIAKLEGDLAKETQEKDDLARKLAAKESIDDTQKQVGKPVRNTATNRAVKKVESFVNKFVNIFGKRDDTTTLQQTEDEAMAEDGEEVIKSFVEAGVYSFGEFMSKFKAVIKGDVPVAARAALRKAWDKLKAQGDIPAPDMSDERQTAELRRLAKMVELNLVEFGITDPEEVIDGVHEALQEVFEDVTRREAMDAMSGYGQYSPPSQKTVDKIIRDLNAQYQQMAKKEDMQQGIAPKKSGRGRDEPSPELRELIREVNEMKRNSKYFITDPESQLKTIFQAIRTGLRNRIYDLNKAIKAKEPIPGRTPNTFEAEQAKEIESLRKQRDELMADYKATFPKPELTFEQRAAIAERAVDREITKIEQQLASGNVAAKERAEPISTPALKDKQNRLESLRAQREAVREMQMTDADMEQRAERLERQAEKAYVANLLNQIADYEDRKAQGYFGPKPKKEPRTLSPREVELSRQLVSLKDEFFRYAAEYRLRNMSKVERFWDRTKETMHLSRAIMTSFDLSAVFRQGGIASLAHPRLAAAASREMLAALRRGDAEFDTMDKISKDELYTLAMRAGLSITTDSGKITRQEEAYMGRWAKWGIGKKGTKINTASQVVLKPIAASARAYTTFLNSMRFRVFKYMVSNLGAGGEVTIDEAKVIASYVNAATGRAELGKFNQAAANLNTVFFAPRYVASRFQYLAMPFYLLPSTKVSGRVKKMIAMEYARHAMGLTAFLGLSVALASLLTDDEEEKPTVEFDPRSSDFMKLKIGDTRIDPMAGLSQTVTLIGQMATGQKKGLRGDIQDLYGENRKFGDPDLWDVGTGFLRKKLAPIPGAIVDLRVGENVIGEKETVLSATTDLFVPLSFQEAGETMKARGLVGGAVVTALSLLGMGGGTYGPKTQYATADAAKREELFGKDLERVKWNDPDLAYKDYLTTAQLDKFNKQREGRKQSLVFSAAADPKRKDYNSDETFKKSVEDRDKALDAIVKAGMGPKEIQLLLIAYYKRNYGSAYETREGVYQMKESLANRLRTIRRKLNEKKTPAK